MAAALGMSALGLLLAEAAAQDFLALGETQRRQQAVRLEQTTEARDRQTQQRRIAFQFKAAGPALPVRHLAEVQALAVLPPLGLEAAAAAAGAPCLPF